MHSNSSKFSYLDGIPFAVNPVFSIEPTKTTKIKKLLNYNFEKAMAILDCKYDFEVENKVLNTEMPSKFESKFLLTHRKKSFSFNKTESKIVEENNAQKESDSSNQILSTSLPSSSINFYTYSNIPLEPIKQYETKKTSELNNDKNNNNFKDLFDSSILDPFNDVELKTLNDLEELKKILNEQEKTKQVNGSVGFYLNDSSIVNRIENNFFNSTITQTTNCAVDNFGLPKISFVDLDANKKL